MIQVYNSQQKAVDHAKYLNFIHRNTESTFGIIPHLKEDWLVCSKEFADDMDIPFLKILPTNYADMDFEHIKSIRTDIRPLKHWEQLSGALATLDGEFALSLQSTYHSKS